MPKQWPGTQDIRNYFTPGAKGRRQHRTTTGAEAPTGAGQEEREPSATMEELEEGDEADVPSGTLGAKGGMHPVRSPPRTAGKDEDGPEPYDARKKSE